MEYREELLRTPEILERVMGEGPEERLVRADKLIFCGCGTSFYLCAQLAKLCAAQGRGAQAVEAVELLDGPPPGYARGTQFVFLSRSGASMETVLAQRIALAAGFATFYLGCTAGSPLDRACGASRVIPYACERLVLESFSSPAQLLCLARCCGLTVAPDAPARVGEALKQGTAAYREVAAGMEPGRIICLGAPFYRPILRELTLKNGEITQVFSEAWGLLEFRHGPRAWADGRCLVTAVPGMRTLGFDRRAAAELVEYGCRVLWCGPEPPEGVRPVPLGTGQYTVEECLALLAFQTGLAAEIGAERGVDAARLRHVVHAVEAL